MDVDEYPRIFNKISKNEFFVHVDCSSFLSESQTSSLYLIGPCRDGRFLSADVPQFSLILWHKYLCARLIHANLPPMAVWCHACKSKSIWAKAFLWSRTVRDFFDINIIVIFKALWMLFLCKITCYLLHYLSSKIRKIAPSPLWKCAKREHVENVVTKSCDLTLAFLQREIEDISHR